MKSTTIFLLFFLPIAAWSQVEVGIRSGVSFSKQKFIVFEDPAEISDRIVGIDAGVMLNWFFLHSFFLQPELSFTQKGGAYPNGSNRINHLEAATLIGYERKNERLSAFISSGLFLDRVVGRPKDGAGPHAPYPPNWFGYNSWGWGLLQSGGVAVQVGKGWIGVSGRYRYSLSDFRNIYDVYIIGDPPEQILNLKNKGWSVNLTYKINIK